MATKKTKKPTGSAKKATAKAPTKTKRRFLKRRERPEVPERKKLSNVYRLTVDTASLIRTHWKTFAGIAAIYFFVASVVVWGFRSASNLLEVYDRAALENKSNWAIGFESFGELTATMMDVSSEAGNAYGTLIFIIVSLALIWVLRHIMAGKKPGIKEAFYQGMYPLVPVLMVLMVFFLQLIPLALGSFLYTVAFNAPILTTGIEQGAVTALGIVFAGVSVYFLSGSIFALYMVSLPDMEPLTALRSSRELVRYRRWEVVRKLLFLPLLLFLVGITIMLPIIIVLPTIAEWVFRILAIGGLVFAHTYLYNLYRELL